jgi:asparagine synthase (glutamine-hydrolysing)
MCGICGVINLENKTVDIEKLEEATSIMKHRGPDDEGYLLIGKACREYGGHDSRVNLPKLKPEKDTVVALGHRRLSIIDVSTSGHQPMCNENRAVWVIFNGELYNYRELKKELAKHTFRSDTDTEVLLHGYEEWGIEKLLEKMAGMWAFSIIDMQNKQAYLVRDRFGIKPLYYDNDGKALVFASEIKAVRILHPTEALNEKRIVSFLSASYYEPNETFFQHIKQVKPGNYLKVNLKTKKAEEKEYWNIKMAKDTLTGKDTSNSYEEIDLHQVSSRFKDLFIESVRLHLRSDVPIGTCLSGGLDSSSIVCTAQKLLDENVIDEKGLTRQVRTFSSVPKEKEVSEKAYIDEVNHQANTEAHTVTPTFTEFMTDLDRLVEMHDEPFLNPSVYMQYRVMQLAKENGVKVLLDGQGADESLGGYHSYLAFYFSDLRRQGLYIELVRELYDFRDQLYPFVGKVFRRKFGTWDRTVKGLVKISPISSSMDKYFSRAKTFAEQLKEDTVGRNLLELLKYEDQNSMIFSIESRVPFLYHPLIEYIFSLPMSARIGNGWTKLMLRESMKGVLPETIRKRRTKLGFPAPDKAWALEMISDYREQLKQSVRNIEKYIDVEIFEKLMRSIMKHKRDEDIKLFWRIVIFERWYRKTMTKTGSTNKKS